MELGLYLVTPMQRERAAVDQVFQSNMSGNPFLLFGIPQKFCIDRAFLDKRFYALSRENHPDRFATSTDLELKLNALKQMSAINEAYQTLINEDLRRESLLEIQGLKSQTAALPAELAEEWFDLQDQVMDLPPVQAIEKIKNFEVSLVNRNINLKQAVLEFEKQWDETQDAKLQNEIAQKISKKITDQSYLKSLLRDVERLKAKIK